MIVDKRVYQRMGREVSGWDTKAVTMVRMWAPGGFVVSRVSCMRSLTESRIKELSRWGLCNTANCIRDTAG